MIISKYKPSLSGFVLLQNSNMEGRVKHRPEYKKELTGKIKAMQDSPKLYFVILRKGLSVSA